MYPRNKDRRPRDFLNNLIEVGDQYFYGAPPTLGRVIAIHGKTITIEYARRFGHGINTVETMKCKSPEKGLCIDKT